MSILQPLSKNSMPLHYHILSFRELLGVVLLLTNRGQLNMIGWGDSRIRNNPWVIQEHSMPLGDFKMKRNIQGICQNHFPWWFYSLLQLCSWLVTDNRNFIVTQYRWSVMEEKFEIEILESTVLIEQDWNTSYVFSIQS